MAKNPSGARSRNAKKRGGAKPPWESIQLTSAPPRESDTLALVDKDDRGDASQRLVRDSRFCGSYMMATNGGATYEDILKPSRPSRNSQPTGPEPAATPPGAFKAENVLGGSDERVLITDTSMIPARSIGLLKIIPEDGVPRYGTAWLIGPRTLATAAHNLLHPEAGATRVLDVGLAYDGNSARGGWHKVVDCAFDGAWRQAPQPGSPFDFAVLRIEDANTGERLGWFGFADYEDAKFGDLVVNIFGYPMDRNRFHMYGAKGRVQDVDIGRIFYDCDAGGGMSGGPVIARFGEQRIAVGVHVAGGSNSNVGTRINDTAFRLFEDHRKW